MSAPVLSLLVAALSNDLLLVCDDTGVVLDAGAVALQRIGARPGRSFLELLTSMSSSKGERFLETTRALAVGASTEAWELHFHCPGTVPLLSGVRAGRVDEGRILVVGAAETPQLTRLYQEVLGINGELTTLVRQLTKEQSMLNQQIERLVTRVVGGGSAAGGAGKDG